MYLSVCLSPATCSIHYNLRVGACCAARQTRERGLVYKTSDTVICQVKPLMCQGFCTLVLSFVIVLTLQDDSKGQCVVHLKVGLMGAHMGWRKKEKGLG